MLVYSTVDSGLTITFPQALSRSSFAVPPGLELRNRFEPRFIVCMHFWCSIYMRCGEMCCPCLFKKSTPQDVRDVRIYLHRMFDFYASTGTGVVMFQDCSSVHACVRARAFSFFDF